MGEKRKDLLQENIEERLKEAKHDYTEKKDPLDAGRIITGIVVGLVVLAIVISAIQTFM